MKDPFLRVAELVLVAQGWQNGRPGGLLTQPDSNEVGLFCVGSGFIK